MRSERDYIQDRRLNWRERRGEDDRRNPYRVHLMEADCRRGVPRRQSDVTGMTGEVDVWWELEYPSA